jgi:hypothetical protein
MARLTKEIQVDSKKEVPENTGLYFKTGAKVTIVSSGWARHGDTAEAQTSEMRGAHGRYDWYRHNARVPDKRIGALLVKNGQNYTALEGGLLNWSPPHTDVLELVYNDTVGGYSNNDGFFVVQIEYDPNDLLA